LQLIAQINRQRGAVDAAHLHMTGFLCLIDDDFILGACVLGQRAAIARFGPNDSRPSRDVDFRFHKRFPGNSRVAMPKQRVAKKHGRGVLCGNRQIDEQTSGHTKNGCVSQLY
jgi:hypothetical protein